MSLEQMQKIMVPGFKGFILLDNGDSFTVTVGRNDVLRVSGVKATWTSFYRSVRRYGLCRLYVNQVPGHIDFKYGKILSCTGQHSLRRVQP